MISEKYHQTLQWCFVQDQTVFLVQPHHYIQFESLPGTQWKMTWGQKDPGTLWVLGWRSRTVSILDFASVDLSVSPAEFGKTPLRKNHWVWQFDFLLPMRTRERHSHFLTIPPRSQRWRPLCGVVGVTWSWKPSKTVEKCEEKNGALFLGEKKKQSTRHWTSRRPALLNEKKKTEQTKMMKLLVLAAHFENDVVLFELLLLLLPNKKKKPFASSQLRTEGLWFW